MRILLWTLLVANLSQAQAQISRASCTPYFNYKRADSVLSCNNKDMTLIFVNGVNVKRGSAEKHLDQIYELNSPELLNASQRPVVNPDPNKKYTDLRAKLSYNFTYTEKLGTSGIYLDIIEALAQTLMTRFDLPQNIAWQAANGVMLEVPLNIVGNLIKTYVPAVSGVISYVIDWISGQIAEDIQRNNVQDVTLLKNLIRTHLQNRQKIIAVTHS